MRRFQKWRPKNDSTWLIKTLKKVRCIKQNRTWFWYSGVYYYYQLYVKKLYLLYFSRAGSLCSKNWYLFCSTRPVKKKKNRVAPVWLWNQFQCKKRMVGVPAHPKDLYPVAKTADFRETYWWLKVGYHFGNQGFIHRGQIDHQWWKFSWSRRWSTNEKGFPIWFTLFYYFFLSSHLLYVEWKMNVP